MADHGFIANGISQIAESMTCIRECGNLYTGRTYSSNFQTHIAGNKMICLTMNQENRNTAVTDSSLCCAAAKPETTIEQGTKIKKGPAKGNGVMLVFAYFFYDGNRGGIGRICNDAGNIIRQVQISAH